MPVSGGSKVLLFQGAKTVSRSDAYTKSGRVFPTSGPIFPMHGRIFPTGSRIFPQSGRVFPPAHEWEWIA